MEGARFDLLFTNAHILTMDGRDTQFAAGYLATNGSDIVALGPMSECPPANQAAETIDCAGCFLLPGLINCHTHLPMVYFRGMADDIALKSWLEDHIWPAERRYLNPDFVYQSTLLAAAECLKCGVTCVNDMYIYADSVARACSDAGLRAFVGEGVIQYPTASAPTWQDGRRLTEELIAKYQDHPLITPTVCVHAPYSCTPEILQAMHAVAREHELLYHIHLHENEQEPDSIDWGREDESPTHSLLRIGVLGPRMVAVHCVWISDHDIGHMQEHDCGVAHCPTSNMKLGNGVAPVHSMIEGNLAVGVGTDGAASNNNLNLWEEIHLSALTAKAAYKNPEVVPAQQALSFATSRAAQLLQAPHIGSLAVGKRADLVVVEANRLHLSPRYSHPDAPYALLVYSAQAAEVRDTVVDGKVLLRNRELTQLDEKELIATAQQWVDQL
jgi:5-methylthioadenosine/S-adenosylhomocysteine deaminase